MASELIQTNTYLQLASTRVCPKHAYMASHRICPRVSYYLTRNSRQEVDFLVSDERGTPVLAVQVSLDISLPDTLKRKLDPLVATAADFGTRENLIITMGREQGFEKDGVTVSATLQDHP